MDIAGAVERGISGQVALITSLSLAVIGGLLALMLQIRMHNADPANRPLTLNGANFVLAALGLAGLSILLGFIITGMLIDMAPLLFGGTFDKTKSFVEQSLGDAPIGSLRILSITQVLTFLGAVGCGLVVVLRNRP